MNREQLGSIEVGEATALRDVIRTIDEGGVEIALVTSAGGVLVGTITDGDVRRAILRGLPLEQPACDVMNPRPVTARAGTGRAELQRLMREHGLKQIPLLDGERRPVELVLWSELLDASAGRPNAAVILAGGLGTRLRPLTNDTPKPLLPVGERPLLHVIVEHLRAHGFRRIFVSVNYRAEQIQRSLGDGSDLDVEIEYLVEQQPLGTAGSVRMAAAHIAEPVLVMNGDLLTRVHFGRFLDYHVEGGYDATVGVKQYEHRVPYGVMDISGDRIAGMREKPVHFYFVNAGLYLLNPEVLELIPPDTPYHMTDLVERLVAEARPVGGFPVHEYWLDIGEQAQYEQANGDIHRLFPGDRACS